MATQKEVADHLGISTRMVRHLEARGTLPPRKGGADYDLDEVRHAYLTHLRSIAAGRGGDGEASLAEARAHLAHLQAEKVELQVKIMKHRYVEQQEIARQLEGVFAVVNDRLHCVAPLAAARIGGDEQERSRNCEAINAEVYGALAELRKPADITLAALAAQEGQA
jgi:terminase small subunit / prophage DNA-packing protein